MPQPFEPTLQVIQGHDLSLSSAAFVGLMREVLARGAALRFCAKGGSMSPFICHGDVISISPLRGRPGLGQVVAFIDPQNERLAVHRIVGRRGECCLIQGDALARVDGLVPRANILGRVSRVERDGRPVRLGLGIERFAIAIVRRRGRLWCIALRLGRPLRFLWRLRPSGRIGAK